MNVRNLRLRYFQRKSQLHLCHVFDPKDERFPHEYLGEKYLLMK